MDIHDRPLVVDHKTGNPRFQTPAATSRQLTYFASWYYQMDTILCKDGVAVMVYLTQTGAWDCYWRTVDQIRDFQEELAALWALLYLVEADQLAPDDPRAQMSCKKKTSKWCQVCDCKRDV